MPKEMLFTNGKIFTGRNETEFVTAFKVAGGKITWVGDAPESDGAFDLQGKTVLPGFIDVHTHPMYVAMTVNAVPCTVPLVSNIEEMVRALKTHPNYGKSTTDWIEGFGYDESKLLERRTPTTQDLDAVSISQPVFVLRSDVHSAICNSRALEIAGITRDTPDPAGARFGRYPNGEPNGFLQEFAARDAVMNAMRRPDLSAKVIALSATGAHYGARGIVAVTDMMAQVEPSDDLDIYRAAAEGGFAQQCSLYYVWPAIRDKGIAGLTEEQRRGRIKFAGVKLFADGSISGRTAWVREPYRNSSDRGSPTLSEDDMESAFEWARHNNVQVAVHAMGDEALDFVIDFFADREPWLSQVPSVRLEHVTLLTDSQIDRMKRARMNFGASTQIIFFFAEHDSYVANLTSRQYRNAYRLKSFYDGVERIGLSSDAPATTWADPDNAFVSIKAAVTRRAYNGADIVAEQAITVPQAVLLWTSRAASVAPFEGSLGCIAPGYEASFIVLDRDIFTIDPEEIDMTLVEQTWIAGQKIFQR